MEQSDSPERMQQLRSEESLRDAAGLRSTPVNSDKSFSEQINYSPISMCAVTSAGLGVLCILGFVFPWLALLAVPGIVLGMIALRSIRRYEISGRILARLGIGLSLLFGLLTPVWSEIRFRSETLPGYRRVNFAAIVNDRKNSEQKLAALVGEHVCLKGYAIPASKLRLNGFQLNYGRAGSSFGWKPDPEKTLMVELPEGKLWEWHYEPIAVSGTMVRNPEADSNSDLPRFKLIQSEVKKAFVFP